MTQLNRTHGPGGAPLTITLAAYEIGRDGVLHNPTDDEVILAAVELARGSWPDGFTVDRDFARRIVAEYDRGDGEFRERRGW